MSKRSVRGKDWHGWCWKANDDDGLVGLFHFAEAEPDKPSRKPSERGRWVRVKFVEVKPPARKR